MHPNNIRMKMQLPKSYRRQKKFEKKCQYPGCGKIFFGIKIAKKCVDHRGEKFRIRNKINYDINIDNQTFKHNYTEVVKIVFNCAFESCRNQFDVKIYPNQYVYPKYCPEHRNEYKRKMVVSTKN